MLYRKVTTRTVMMAACALAAAATALACSGSDDSGSKNQPSTDGGGTGGGTSGSGGATGGTAGTTGGTAGSGGTAGTGGVVTGGVGGTGGSGGIYQDPTDMKWYCGGVLCQCNDGIDNDNDQTTDALDPNCAAGPYTNSEAGSTSGGGCGTTQCTDCVDNDDDGLVDSADPECTGGLDNDEGTYATGIPGDNSDACKQDCFFDGNSGAGDDHCNWDLKCDPANPGQYTGCPYDSTYNNCQDQQTQTCIDYCQAYTPNGCDCFGCCQVYDNDGVAHTVKLADTCSVENLNDPTLCPPCTLTTACANTCELCEYCLGKEPTDPSCFPSVDAGVPDASTPDAQPPPVNTCGDGVQPCVPGDISGCPASYYCLTGCCVPQIR